MRAPGQSIAEVYYCVTLFQNFVLTPDVRVIVDPAHNPDESSIVILGLGARWTL